MSSGFLENSDTPTLSGSAYVKITLEKPSSFAPSLELPAGMVRWSHIELVVNKSGSITNKSFEAYLSWDANGDDIAAGPTQTAINMVQGKTTTTRYMASATFDVNPSRPSQGAQSQLYLFVKVHSDLNSASTVRARLYWHSITKG